MEAVTQTSLRMKAMNRSISNCHTIIAPHTHLYIYMYVHVCTRIIHNVHNNRFIFIECSLCIMQLSVHLDL